MWGEQAIRVHAQLHGWGQGLEQSQMLAVDLDPPVEPLFVRCFDKLEAGAEAVPVVAEGGLELGLEGPLQFVVLVPVAVRRVEGTFQVAGGVELRDERLLIVRL